MYTMLVMGLMLMVANMSVEPIIALYVGQVAKGNPHIHLLSGMVLAAAPLGSVLTARSVGKLVDRIGTRPVLVACFAVCAGLLIPQVFVTEVWQLVALRLLMGVALAGVLPAIATRIRHTVPEEVTSGALGYSQSAPYLGQVVGPVLGGFLGGHFGVPSCAG